MRTQQTTNAKDEPKPNHEGDKTHLVVRRVLDRGGQRHLDPLLRRLQGHGADGRQRRVPQHPHRPQHRRPRRKRNPEPDKRQERTLRLKKGTKGCSGCRIRDVAGLLTVTPDTTSAARVSILELHLAVYVITRELKNKSQQESASSALIHLAQTKSTHTYTSQAAFSRFGLIKSRSADKMHMHARVNYTVKPGAYPWKRDNCGSNNTSNNTTNNNSNNSNTWPGQAS